jgi:hypothetical protein
LVRPATTQVVAVEVVQVFALGDEVTVYLVIGAPLLAGASHVTEADSGSGDAVGLVTWAGLPNGVAASLGSDWGLSPTAFVATSVSV